MEYSKVVGRVSPDETKEIKVLFERKNGLLELAKIVNADNTELYEKLVEDIGRTDVKFHQWWGEKAKQYGWESHPEGHWVINFQTGVITLIVK